jgi:DNA-3-methyladenine glycosylase I
MPRCPWAGNELSIAYHDKEWGRPVRDDRTFFEFLILEGAQAGLSWDTILKKRERYREVYEGFDPQRVARFGPRDEKRLLADPGIVRNRLKVASSISNAKAFLELRDEFGTAGLFLWRFVDAEAKSVRAARPIVNTWKARGEVPASTTESDAMSKGLRKRGFRFVGSTICYAFMQATGLVNDHLVSCPCHKACQR